MGLLGREQGIYCDVRTTPTRTSPLYWTECAAAAADGDYDDGDDGDDDELK